MKAGLDAVVERDREIMETLAAFYDPNCLVLISSLGSLQNIALAITRISPLFGAVMAQISAEAVGAIAMMSKRTPAQVTADVITVAQARLLTVKP